MEHRINAGGLLALGVAASAASLAFLPIPFAGFFLTWAFVLATLAGRLQRAPPALLRAGRPIATRTRQEEEAMLVAQSPTRT